MFRSGDAVARLAVPVATLVRCWAMAPWKDAGQRAALPVGGAGRVIMSAGLTTDRHVDIRLRLFRGHGRSSSFELAGPRAQVKAAERGTASKIQVWVGGERESLAWVG